MTVLMSHREECGAEAGAALFFSSDLFCAFCPSHKHSFVRIRKEMVANIDKVAAKMEKGHHFLPKFNTTRAVCTRVRQTKGLGWV